jgi:glycosyltransferase involved in cell wall biosynthesis
MSWLPLGILALRSSTQGTVCCLYQHASLLFLPLIEATANNAVVESFACGLAVISSAIGAFVNTLFLLRLALSAQ